jgi:hypothetical protein
MSDNFFQNCPAKMEDQGRHLADFQSSTRRDEYIKYVNDIYRDDQYRLFLQSNGREIMDREWAFHKKYSSCWDSPCIHKFPSRCNARQYWEERQAYDSTFNMNTREPLAPLRKCGCYKDFRMISDQNNCDTKYF